MNEPSPGRAEKGVRCSPTDVLALPIPPHYDGDPPQFPTVGHFLRGLLTLLWHEQDQFSGKRPWGDSGWTDPVERALLDAGVVDGGYDEDGYVDWIDMDAVDCAVFAAIGAMGAS